MNNTILITLFFALSLISSAQNYKPADEGSKIHFVIKNFGINTGGDLSGLKGSIFFDPDNLPACDFNVSVDVSTIDTDSENRDKHLRSDSYFDVDRYPVIAIRSEKITGKPGAYNFTGILTMHGVTKNISFPFVATPQGNDFLFSGEFEINRLDYSVGEPSSILSKTVKVSLSVLAKKN